MALSFVVPAGDIDIVDGDIVLADGVDYTRQKLASRFKFFLGEWFLNTLEGVPYFENVFIKNPDLDVIRAIFRKVALSVQGVASVQSFDLVYNPAARTLGFSFTAIRVNGDAISVKPDDSDFVITVKN